MRLLRRRESKEPAPRAAAVLSPSCARAMLSPGSSSSVEATPSSASSLRTLPFEVCDDSPDASVRQRSEEREADEPPAKRTPQWKAAGSNSPTKLKAIARSTVKLPPLISQSTMPKLEDVTAASLLAWHAGRLVLHHNLKEKRLRRTSKTPFDTEDLLVTLAANPWHQSPEKPRTCVDRLKLKFGVARIFSKVYNLGIREGRAAWQLTWSVTPADIRENWARLLEAEGYEKLEQEAEPKQEEVEPVSRAVDCHGAMLTWQTALGRGDDIVRHWLSHKISRDVLVELMEGDESCKAIFKTFCAFVDNLVSQNGFKHYACAMELNAQDAARAVVHLHAYVAISWVQGRTPELVKGKLQQEDWQYCGFAPHVTLTKIKRNADPRKLICQGLFYCAAPKIGSVFRHCSIEPGKDRALCPRAWMPRLDGSCRNPEATSAATPC